MRKCQNRVRRICACKTQIACTWQNEDKTNHTRQSALSYKTRTVLLVGIYMMDLSLRLRNKKKRKTAHSPPFERRYGDDLSGYDTLPTAYNAAQTPP